MENFSVDKLYGLLTTDQLGKNTVFMKECTSTNDVAKSCTDKSCPIVFIAAKQTNGRGRQGHVWESGNNGGVYMSLLVKPDIPPMQAAQITPVLGLAVARALGDEVEIKWPNDIVLGNKKVCGILTELSGGSIVCGIGINVNNTSFEASLPFATSLYLQNGITYSYEDVVAKVLNEFEPMYYEFLKNGFGVFLSEYTDRCVNIGSDIKVISGDSEITGVAQGISHDGSLIVKTESGIISVASGDVSVRGLYGYV